MVTHPLDRPASVPRLQEWRQKGHIDAQTHATLTALVRPVTAWRQWAAAAFLVLGTALLLAGIIFFFAWNWGGMAKWQRLALPMAGALLAGLASRVLPSTSLGHKMALTGGAVLIGVFLAVFGQEYQTGADAYGLFVGWALLALPWVLAAEFPPLCVLWLLIASTGIVTWWFQDGGGVDTWNGRWQACLLSVVALHAAALALRELLAPRLAWLGAKWFRHWLLAAVLLPLCGAACGWVLFDFFEVSLPTLVWLISASGAFVIYRFILPDAAAMALAAGSAGAVLVSGSGRLLWRALVALEESSLVFLGFLLYLGVLGMLISGIVWALQRIAMTMHSNEERLAQRDNPTGSDAGKVAPNDGMVPDEPARTWRWLLSAATLETKHRETLEHLVSSSSSQWRAPAWLKAASALGAWVAAILFMPVLWWFLAIVGGADNPVVYGVLGSVILAIGCRLSGRLETSFSLQQLNLALALGGVGLTVLAIYLACPDFDHWAHPAALGGIALATYPLFRNAVFRFLIALFFAISVTLWILAQNDSRNVLLPLWVALLSITTAVVWSWRDRPALLNPFAQATALSLGGLVVFQTSLLEFAWLNMQGPHLNIDLWVLAGSVVFMICMLNRGWKSLTSPWGIATAGLCAVFAILGQAGLLVGLLIAVAGFAWGDRMLSFLSWLYMSGSLFLLYYSLQIPLSQKALVIGGSGLALLLLRMFLVARDRGMQVRNTSTP